MPERARAVWYVLDSEGRPIPTATITLRDPGTANNIAATIYAADDPDTSQLTNGAFFSGADGKVEFYLVDPDRVDMLVTKSGYSSQTIPIDVQKSSLIGNHALIDTAVHTASGLTTGHVIKATGATTYAFGVNPLEDKITTAGDLLYGTAADTAARLGIGTAGQVLKVNAGATAPEWGASLTGDLLDWQYVRKSADESVTSSTALQNDDHLTLAIAANETWALEYILFLSGADAGDFKSALSVPAGATGWRGGIGPGVAATSGESDGRFTVKGDFTNDLIFGTNVTDTVTALIRTIVINGANAGNVVLQWAQNTSNGTATQVRQNSHLLARRVA